MPIHSWWTTFVERHGCIFTHQWQFFNYWLTASVACCGLFFCLIVLIVFSYSLCLSWEFNWHRLSRSLWHCLVVQDWCLCSLVSWCVASVCHLWLPVVVPLLRSSRPSRSLFSFAGQFFCNVGCLFHFWGMVSVSGSNVFVISPFQQLLCDFTLLFALRSRYVAEQGFLHSFSMVCYWIWSRFSVDIYPSISS